MKKSLLVLGAVALVAAVAVPAMAETTLYGSARVGTFWDTNRAAYSATASAPEGNTDFDMRNQATSRFGATATNGALGGKVELGLGGVTAGINPSGASVGSGGNTTVYTRLIYGTYKFDAGTLLVGQTYAPYWMPSDQVINEDNVSNGFGSIYDGRSPQIKFTMNNGVYVDLIRPGANANAFATTETLMPKIAVGYDGKFGNLAIGGGVAGQTYKLSAADKQVNSFLGYAHGKFAAGPATVGLNLGVGQNLGDMGIAEGLSANVTGTKVNNNLTFSILATAGFKAADMLSVNAGVGFVSTDGKTGATGADFANADTKMSAYVNAPIMLAKGVTVVPEFTYQDQMKSSTGAHETRDFIYGAKWQMDF